MSSSERPGVCTSPLVHVTTIQVGSSQAHDRRCRAANKHVRNKNIEKEATNERAKQAGPVQVGT